LISGDFIILTQAGYKCYSRTDGAYILITSRSLNFKAYPFYRVSQVIPQPSEIW